MTSLGHSALHGRQTDKPHGHNEPLGTFSHIAAKLEFSRIWTKSPFVTELQRQNVLKFEIFQMNSFEDMVVQSRSGPTKIRQDVSQATKRHADFERKMFTLYDNVFI